MHLLRAQVPGGMDRPGLVPACLLALTCVLIRDYISKIVVIKLNTFFLGDGLLAYLDSVLDHVAQLVQLFVFARGHLERGFLACNLQHLLKEQSK